MSLFRNKIYLAIVLGHLIIDIFNSTAPVLVTFLSIPMALTTTQIGISVGAYQMIAAITQPLFGWITDKIGSRWLGPLSVSWTVGFLALAVLVAQMTNNFVLFLIPFGLAAVGSGAFHPIGTMHAGTLILDRAATATAVFFLFGQSGLALGPALSGLVLENLGTPGIYGMALLAIPCLFFMTYAMRDALVLHKQRPTPPTLASSRRIMWGAIALIALVTGLRSWIFIGTVSFVPKVFQDMGWSASGYGFITGVFWMSSAVAGVIGGSLADRFGRRQVLFITLILGAIPLYFMPITPQWELAVPLAMATGGLLGASHSILLVMAQKLLPGQEAFASGVALGYLFGIGAVGAWGIGAIGDVWGLPFAIQLGTGLGITAGILSLFLPPTRKQPSVAPVPATQESTPG